MCVCLLEDEPAISELLVEALEEEGFPVLHASSVAEAAACLGGSTRVLIADRNLGSGEDGHEFAADARITWPGLAVIYMTGGAARGNGRALRPREWVLLKPFRPSRLAEMVRDALGGWPPHTICTGDLR